MSKDTWWIKAIGGLWLALGAAAIVWGTAAIAWGTAAIAWGTATIAWGAWTLPGLSGDASNVVPWLAATSLALGAAVCIDGVGLLSNRGWAQGLTASTHALLAVYAFAMLPLAYSSLPAPRLAGAVGLGFAGLVNVALALLISSAGVRKALSWLPLQTVYLQTARCEFCGAPLDPQTETCPHCEAIPDIVREHLELQQLRAALVNDEIGVQFPLSPTGKTRIGRGADQNEIDLNNPTVSRSHAWIECQNGSLLLYANDDANGTFVNEQRVRRHMLRNGDQLRLGRVRLRVVIEQGQGK